MCVAHYDKNSAPVIPDRFEVFVDQSEASSGDFITRIYWIDDWDDLCLVDELAYGFIPTIDELIKLGVFNR